MQIAIIVLILLVLVLSARLYFLHRAISTTSEQMMEIEQNPESNRQLKTSSPDHVIEELLKQINNLYQTRQQERIVYQRRETQIRREIENISHDLRTPLTSILGYVELIREEETGEKEREEYLGIIQKRAKILQGFIQDFYEISRIEGDNYPFLLDSISVQSTIKEAAVAYYHEFEGKSIQVEVELDEMPSYIIADKIQFNRILNNLIQNALKYAEQQFKITQSTKDGYCILRFINDTGNITEDELSHIFERFYIGDQSRNSQSSGLGLTITKALVEKMKGQIEARIEMDMFVIELRWMVRSFRSNINI